jgi:hypothetical protein
MQLNTHNFISELTVTRGRFEEGELLSAGLTQCNWVYRL